MPGTRSSVIHRGGAGFRLAHISRLNSEYPSDRHGSRFAAYHDYGQQGDMEGAQKEIKR